MKNDMKEALAKADAYLAKETERSAMKRRLVELQKSYRKLQESYREQYLGSLANEFGAELRPTGTTDHFDLINGEGKPINSFPISLNELAALFACFFASEGYVERKNA